MNTATKNDKLLNDANERSNLAGNNKMELLIFGLVDEKTGTTMDCGINVFKVREVLETPPINSIPLTNNGVVGMVNLRGQIISVIDLPGTLNLSPLTKDRKFLIITEYNNSKQGFLVDKLDNIVRLDWSEIKSPPTMSNNMSLTAITEVEGKLVSILDVENIIANLMNKKYQDTIEHVEKVNKTKEYFIYFADDSKTARDLITKTLDKMQMKYKYAENGQEAFDALMNMARLHGDKLKDHLSLILTDIEMPEMDGFTLVKKLKEDKRFKDIPILMHSSLTGGSNRKLGEQMGIDDFIDKFNPMDLSKIIQKHLKI